MATGQVSFHNPKQVKKVFIAVRQNPIVNRLNKTRVEKFPDLQAEKEEILKKQRKEERRAREEKKLAEKKERQEREQLKWQKEHAYDDLFSEENMMQSSNQDRGEDFLDDFMWCLHYRQIKEGFQDMIYKSRINYNEYNEVLVVDFGAPLLARTCWRAALTA